LLKGGQIHALERHIKLSKRDWLEQRHSPCRCLTLAMAACIIYRRAKEINGAIQNYGSM
jgi:hypothetical protein